MARLIYGKTWWGEQFLNAFNEIDYSNRLLRGKSYANTGKVHPFTIKNNTIQTYVDGSERYRVKIVFTPLTEDQVKVIQKIILDSPSTLSALLSHTLPETFATQLATHQIMLFPSSWKDLSGSFCSCPDHAVPCKHIAAVIYTVTTQIDQNPFIIFTLKNLNLAAILNTMNAHENIQDKIIPTIRQLLTPQSTVDANSATTTSQSLNFSDIPPLRNYIFHTLHNNPSFAHIDFKRVLELAYIDSTRFLQKRPCDHFFTKTIPLFKKQKQHLTKANPEEQLFLLHWNNPTRWQSLTLEIDTNYQILPESMNAAAHGKHYLAEFFNNIPHSLLNRMCPDIQYVATVSQFSTKLIQKSAFIPQIIMNDTGAFFIRWIPALFNEQVRKNYELLIQRCPDKIVTHNEHPIRKEAQVASLISAFISDAIHPSPYHTDPVKTSSDKDIYNLFFRKEPFRTLPLTAQVPIAIRNWLSNFYFSKRDHTLYLMIKEEGLENFSININVGMENKALPIPLLTALKTKNTTLRSALLSNISLLCSYIPCLATVIDTQKAALLNFESFGELFLKILPIMQVIGVEVILPKSLKNALHPKLNLKLTSKKKTQSRGQSLLNLATLLDFNWQVAIGEKIISPEAFKQLLTTSRGLIRFGDKYLVLEEAEIKALLKKLNALPEKLSNFDLLQATLGHEYEGAIVSLDEPLQKFILQAITPSLPQAPPCNLKAQLRPYQIKGFNWLLQNINAGFGSILADDMGLGKTLQIITTLLHLKNNNHLNNENQALIVVPTSLISNWCKEVAKFAPDLTISPYYGNKRELSATSDIIITSYGIIRRDSKNFNEKSWLLMIIDEAQNIKTPTAAQTKQVKLIDARHKIALSGTPVENRLSEYWSIFDFTNAGYLKTIGHFNKHYSIPIEEERDGHCLERFKKITAPFILRRVKSDKSIIGDLPQKIEKNQYCSLTTEQAALYEEVVNNAWQSIESSAGMARRGLILKLITSLKQVCNHPASFTKKKLNFKTSTAQETVIQQSGKLQALQELLSEIELSEEKTLIFTQYVEMGILLQQVLSTEETRIPFLYGDLSRTERDAIIESFQTSNATRILIVSLKAGGTGLNLTAANHIIHYDLWWNPAVEAQATDRAYRIGQNKNVMVHRLIVSGTFEEKIDALIQSKKELADLTLGKGESWITEMKPSELHELIALRKATTD